MKKFLAASVLLVLAIGVYAMGGSETTVTISAKEKISLRVPLMSVLGLWSDFSCLIEHVVNNRRNAIAKLLVNAFDRPVFLLYDDERRLLYVLYDFDVSYELLVLTIGSGKMQIPAKFEKIVRNAEVEIRTGAPEDLAYLKSYFETATDMSIRKGSIPVINLGIYKHHLDRKAMRNMLERVSP